NRCHQRDVQQRCLRVPGGEYCWPGAHRRHMSHDTYCAGALLGCVTRPCGLGDHLRYPRAKALLLPRGRHINFDRGARFALDDLLPGTLRSSLYLNTALALDKERREGNLQLGCELLASFVRITLKEAGNGVAAPQEDAEAV